MPALDQFRGHKVVVIESYGSDNKPVLTCCHFVERDGRLFTRSPVTTQNVARIKARSDVRVAPSHADSVPCGEWINAAASISNDRDSCWVPRALRQKYGWSRIGRLIAAWFRRGCHSRKYAIIEIEPTTR